MILQRRLVASASSPAAIRCWRDERARKREDLLVATEKKLAAIAARVHRAKKPLRGKDKIALAIGRVIDKYKMAKHLSHLPHEAGETNSGR
jgi:hypothetical protein